MNPDYFLPSVLAIWTAVGLFWWGFAWFSLVSRVKAEAASDGDFHVSIFKPVASGEIPGVLSDALHSFINQLEEGDELLLGVVEADAPAWRQWAERYAHPGLRVVAVEAPPQGRINRKMFTLSQLSSVAKNRHWFWSDADIFMPARTWNRIKAEYQAASGLDGAALTCSYRIRDPGAACGMLEALYVNAELQPGVRAAACLGGGRVFFALGAGTLFDSRNLRQADFEAMVTMLADDYQLGRRLGRAAVSSVVLETPSAEHDWRSAVLHYLRWHKTVRWSQPSGYAGQVVLLPLLGWSVAAALFPSPATVAGFVCVLTVDSLMGGILGHRLGLRPGFSGCLVLPLWAMLRAWVWVLVWLPWPVVWRGILWWRSGP